MADKANENNNQAPPKTDETTPTSHVEGGDEQNSEEVQKQLDAMEEEQQKLAARFDPGTELQQLDSKFAVIEEQFRRNFDDRIAAPTGRGARPSSFISLDSSGSGGAGGEVDFMKLNTIFREVSRELGTEWKPVFTDLMAKFPPDVVSAELEKIEKMQPIVRGYRSLNVWRDCAGADFVIRDLVDALRKNNLNELADATVAIIEGTDTGVKTKTAATRKKTDATSRGKTACLDNRRLLLLAKKIGGDWEGLGNALGLPAEELKSIKEDPDNSTYQGAFKILWAWRQTQPEIEQDSSVLALKAALVQANKQTLADDFFPA